MQDTMWILMADWFDCKNDIELQPNEYYFFDCAEDALDKAYQLCHDSQVWNDADKPFNLCLFKHERDKPFVEDGGYYHATWNELDKKIRDID